MALLAAVLAAKAESVRELPACVDLSRTATA